MTLTKRSKESLVMLSAIGLVLIAMALSGCATSRQAKVLCANDVKLDEKLQIIRKTQKDHQEAIEGLYQLEAMEGKAYMDIANTQLTLSERLTILEKLHKEKLKHASTNQKKQQKTTNNGTKNTTSSKKK